MNDFSYHNLFETKGIEYLLTILFFALLIPFWLILNRRPRAVPAAQRANQSIFKWLAKAVPAGILFHKNHTWVHLGQSGKAKLGLSEILLHLTNNFYIHHLKQEGDIITKGDSLVQIRAQNKHLTILSPVSGKLGKRNTSNLGNAEQLVSDPYGKGWVLELEPSNWQEETHHFYLADKAGNWLNKELNRLKQFLSEAVYIHQNETLPLVMQDGGELMDHPLNNMPESIWADFQEEFLNK